MSARRWLTLALGASLGTGALLALTPRPPLSEGLSFSQAVYDRDGRLLRLTLSDDGKYRLWLPLCDISPLLVDATILHEDKGFRVNSGVDLPALARSAWVTYVEGKRRVGGSTITMQLARMRYRVDSRTIPGKILEILRALQLEALYSKDEILEAYLNLAPYGGNVEGAGAASLVYFDKDADQLTLSEALALAVIPQNPVRRTLTGANRADAKARETAKRALFKRWLEKNPQDAAQRQAVELPEDPTPRALPFEAPQFVQAALEGRGSARLVTTLDLPKQKLAERLVRAYVERRRAQGVRNAAVLLVDRRTMEVLASVGSADFFDASIEGQVDGTRARRSPGSALKPFVYALALDQGLIHEQTMLKDAPTSFGAYDPENFDGDFAGPIKAHDALIKSRNVPAVALASRLAAPGLYGLLQQAGVRLDCPPEHYGLGIVLGGAEATMQDLAVLYSALADGGRARPLRLAASDPQAAGRQLFSREAAFVVMQMLKDNPRPDQGFSSAWTAQAPPVYWKTGTSYAYRDAWTAGVFGPYTLVVWVGNFDGTGNPAFVGVEAAAPLFFQLADALRAQGLLDDVFAGRAADGLNVRRVRVCAVSGMLPGPHCRETMWSWFIPGVSPIARCSVHREILVDRATGLRACAGSQANTRAEVFEVWPSDLLKLFRAAGIPRRTPPPYAPGCALAQAGPSLPPRIASPLSGVTYLMRVGRPEPIALTAAADGEARKLYWFVDQQPVGQGPPGRPLFWDAQPGRYVVRVIDDRGRSDAREVEVAASQ